MLFKFLILNFNKYKAKRTPRMNILVHLKYKTNKELFKKMVYFDDIISSFSNKKIKITVSFLVVENDEIISTKYTTKYLFNTLKQLKCSFPDYVLFYVS